MITAVRSFTAEERLIGSLSPCGLGLAVDMRAVREADEEDREHPPPVFLRPSWLAALDYRIREGIAGRLDSTTHPGIKPIGMVVQAPPRHGKSYTTSIFTPSWYLGLYPRRRVMLTSNEASLARDFGQASRDLLSDVGPDLYGVSVRQDSRSSSDWRTTAGGGMLTAGVGGAITGKGGDLLIIDDPFKNAEQASSLVIREKVWHWWLSTARTRLHPGGFVILVLTRWHDDDLAGRLLKAAREDPDVDQWHELRLPALAEADDPLGRKPGEPLWPARYDAATLEKTRKSSGPYWWCTPAETPIVMDDWTSRPIAEVRPGDRIAGFQRGTPDRRGRMLPATVEAVSSRMADVVKITLASGRVIRCTASHRWYTGRGGDRKTYDVAQVGRDLRYVMPPEDHATPVEREAWQYLAGLVDGEGNISPSALRIAQSPTSNPETHDAIRSVLDELGLAYGETRGEHTNPKWGDYASFNVRDIQTVYRKLIRLTRTAKRQQMIDMLYERSGWFGKVKDRVVSIEPDGHERVYALQTTTGNYVAWGYASSNSAMYQQRPSPDDGGIFRSEHIGRYRVTEWANLPGRADQGWGQTASESWAFTRRIPSVVRLEIGGGKLGPDIGLGHQRIFQTVDLAASENQTADFTVITTFAVTSDGDLLVMDVERRRIAGPDQPELVTQSFRDWDPESVHVERIGYQIALLQALTRQGLPIVPLNADKDKVTRAALAATRYKSGKVWHPSSAPWLDTLEAEMLAFPVGEHDDQVDTIAYGARVQMNLPGATRRARAGGQAGRPIAAGIDPTRL